MKIKDCIRPVSERHHGVSRLLRGCPVQSYKGGGALPQVRVRNFGEGVFGTLN